jgi:hypothetical protein
LVPLPLPGTSTMRAGAVTPAATAVTMVSISGEGVSR